MFGLENLPMYYRPHVWGGWDSRRRHKSEGNLPHVAVELRREFEARNGDVYLEMPQEDVGTLSDVGSGASSSSESSSANNSYPKEKRKTVIALLMLMLGFVSATLSLAVTHERLPDRRVVKPLPDIVLDNLPTKDWALTVSEYIIMAASPTMFLVLIFHQHRWIVIRRAFLILAALYLMRSLTMFVTVLPVSSFTYYCSPPTADVTAGIIVRRAIRLMSGFGLSVNGEHVFCGDYIFSGHTVMLVSTYLFIKEYSPSHWYALHWVSFTASLIGVFMVLIARGHYTIDVIVAYYVTTTLFWMYHTMANTPILKLSPNTNRNLLGRVWWYRIFNYMEGNLGVGPLPQKYGFPWPSWEDFRKDW